VVSSGRHPGSVPFVVNVEAGTETKTEFWPTWQGEVINGVYPLRRLLGGSDHSAVFLTECTAQGVATAAIKIVPAERLTLAQLSHWRTAAGLSHPHLIRLLDAGLCDLGGRQSLFVVMEYADQTLAQVLAHRALTEQEVQEMLPAILEALAFLHRNNLVQGQLKPANVLVVGDQLKLASDTVRPADEPRASIVEPSLYDPPEAKSGKSSPAGDIWALGITMVEALTQRPPAWPEGSETASLPMTLAPTLVDTINRCLSHDPARRPTVIDLEAQLKPAPPAPVDSVAQPVVRETPGRPYLPQDSPEHRSRAPIFVAILVLLVAIWAGLRVFQRHPDSQRPAAGTVERSARHSAGAPAPASQAPKAPPSAPRQVSAPLANAKPREPRPAPPRQASPRPEPPAQPPPDSSPSVVHEQIPVAPLSARETIHGRVRVAVLVIVDPSGNVIDALMQDPGPSSYFARLAKDAATKWKFIPADGEDSRKWLLKFEFARDGVTGHATPRP
jgi:TonB family protein